MDNVTQFPAPPEQPPLLVGPFEEWRVMVEGRVIPRLTGWREGDKVWLSVDRRFCAGFGEEDARQAAWLIAQALAIGEGFASLGADKKDRCFAPKGMGIMPSEPSK